VINLKIRDDSRKIKKGDTFIAIDGGQNYIDDAIKKGAKKIINEENIYDVDTLVVNDTRQYLADYLEKKFKNKLNKLTLIGITGTNGKTTTAYLIYQLFNAFKIRTAYIGTIGFYINDEVKALNNTTPDLIELYDMFNECINKNIKVIVMEVSSHALKLNRVLGLHFDYAIYTNLTHDHLDFHKNLDNYKEAKRKLFTMLKRKKYAIINSDDSNYKDFILSNNYNITYGISGEYRLLNYNLKIDGSDFSLIHKNRKYNIDLKIPCLYNIYNFMAALIVINKYGFTIPKIIEKAKKLKSPRGRMEIVYNQEKYVLIDYAHTPDAVFNVLKNVQKFKTGRIITIIGCGGNRDKLKRPIMGDIATKNSDFVIFTNDNPRNENEQDIMKDITYNLERTNYEIIFNREIAIKKGISMISEKDILLILGKGHENYQIIGNKKFYFDDKEIALKYLNMK